jgi:geranylgeranyl diphosphate synthase, type II
MDILSYLNEKRKLIDQQLNELIPEKPGPFQQLHQAARYSLFGNGKRMRPLLALATCEAFNGKEELAIQPVCALEFIHTYSLIHDDLPCIDNDDFRRGKPTLHKAFSEGHALLTGDFLLTFAFETLVKAPTISNEQKIKLIETLSCKAGSQGMIGGQVMDIEGSDRELDLETLRFTHQLKTGALITASVLFGGILANADSTQMELLRMFGEEIGLAFQIIDDIHDITLCEQKHGKFISSDVINKKSTYVTLLGLEKSQQIAFELFDSAVNKLNQLKCNTSLLRKLAEIVVYRQN